MAVPESSLSIAFQKAYMHRGEHNWLAVAPWCFLAMLLGVVFGVLWRSPPIHDEITYYYPALEAYAKHLPEIWLNLPFPGPPTGLLLQLPVFYAFDGSWVALRAFSTLAAAATSIVLFSYLRRRGTSHREAAHLLMMSASPFVLYPAFIFKHHSFMLLFLVSALVLWQKVVIEKASPYLLVACSLLLTLAITTNQLVAPVCVGLAFEAWRTRAEESSVLWWWPAAAALVPIAVLGMFFLTWHGVMPPAYRANPVVQGYPLGQVRPAQVLACFLVLGLWMAPSLGLDRKSLIRSAVLTVPFGLAFYGWNGYRATMPFFDTIVGQISSALRFISARSLVVAAAVGRLLCGLGTEFVLRGRHEGRGVIRLDVLVVSYLGMMLVVPYLFESYYFILFVTACFVLRAKIAEAWPSPIVVLHRSMMVVMGIVYTVFKVRGIG